jgi:hypothetical protein
LALDFVFLTHLLTRKLLQPWESKQDGNLIWVLSHRVLGHRKIQGSAVLPVTVFHAHRQSAGKSDVHGRNQHA